MAALDHELDQVGAVVFEDISPARLLEDLEKLLDYLGLHPPAAKFPHTRDQRLDEGEDGRFLFFQEVLLLQSQKFV